jgi:hypothetical protein
MRLALGAIAAAAIAVVVASAPVTTPSAAQAISGAKSPAPALLGISYRDDRPMLKWFDPLTLNALPGRKVRLGDHGGSWVFSSDRSVLAIGGCEEHDVPSIRFVNARAMRVLGDVRMLPGGDCVDTLAWLRPQRLLGIVRGGGTSDAAVAIVDPATRRLLRRIDVYETGTYVANALATRNELVLLREKEGDFAPARLSVVDPDGNLRSTTVDRILAGQIVDPSSSDYRSRTVTPGFAVDPVGRRAFLVSASGPVAEVDLQTLAVSYHDLDHPPLLRRFLRWLTPAAEAKAMEGPYRSARWLGDGMLAVSGTDYSIGRNAKGEETEIGAPAGVQLIDTSSWTSRTLSPESTDVATAPHLVIAQGGRWDAEAEKTVGPGVVAFGLDGREHWRLPQPALWIDSYSGVGYGYVDVEDSQRVVKIIDLATGSVVRALKRDWASNPRPALLDAQSSQW